MSPPERVVLAGAIFGFVADSAIRLLPVPVQDVAALWAWSWTRSGGASEGRGPRRVPQRTPAIVVFPSVPHMAAVGSRHTTYKLDEHPLPEDISATKREWLWSGTRARL